MKFGRQAKAGLVLAVLAGCSRAPNQTGESGESSSDATDSDGTGSQAANVRIWSAHQQTCAVLDDTSLHCWGRNLNGSLGVGSTEPIGDDEHPSVLPGLDFSSRIVDVPMSASNGCVVEENGRIHCWGSTLNGALGFAWNDEQLGDDETILDAPDVDLGAGVIQVAVGRLFACAVYQSGEVRCWGKSDVGQTGYPGKTTVDPVADGISPKDLAPVEVGAPVKHISAGDRHACAVTKQGEVKCWGSDSFGTLGQGKYGAEETFIIGDDEAPSAFPPIELPGPPVSAVSVEANVVCALHEDGAITCWGESSAALGYGSAIDAVGAGYGDDETPSSLGHVNVGGAATKVDVGYNFACALLESGKIRCWGTSPYGQLGRGDYEVVGYPKVPADHAPIELGGSAVDIVAGHDHACALLGSGDVRCWGTGGFGALGYASTENVGDDEVPASMPPVEIR